MERAGTLKSYVEAPRWAKFPDFLKNYCFIKGLELELDIDKHFIRETIRFKISGSESELQRVKKVIEESIEEYNQ